MRRKFFQGNDITNFLMYQAFILDDAGDWNNYKSAWFSIGYSEGFKIKTQNMRITSIEFSLSLKIEN